MHRAHAQQRATAENQAQAAWRWWLSRRSQLERLKAEADASEDYRALAVYARTLFAHEAIEPAHLLPAFDVARAADPAGVAALIAKAIADETLWARLDQLVLEGIRRTCQPVGVAA